MQEARLKGLEERQAGTVRTVDAMSNRLETLAESVSELTEMLVGFISNHRSQVKDEIAKFGDQIDAAEATARSVERTVTGDLSLAIVDLQADMKRFRLEMQGLANELNNENKSLDKCLGEVSEFTIQISERVLRLEQSA